MNVVTVGVSVDRVELVKQNVQKIHEGLKVSFSKVKNELNEHLDAINQNTDEIQLIYGYLSELDTKLDKLSERMDELTLIKSDSIEQKFDIQLSAREEEIFLVLYTASKPTSINQIAKILGLTDELVNAQVYKLISKGIPLQKEIIEAHTCFSLDKTFKDLQARKNLIKVDERVLEQFVNLNS